LIVIEIHYTLISCLLYWTCILITFRDSLLGENKRPGRVWGEKVEETDETRGLDNGQLISYQKSRMDGMFDATHRDCIRDPCQHFSSRS
jgi:hypothetical protein